MNELSTQALTPDRTARVLADITREDLARRGSCPLLARAWEETRKPGTGRAGGPLR